MTQLTADNLYKLIYWSLNPRGSASLLNGIAISPLMTNKVLRCLFPLSTL